jgi:hypothetical protein
VQPIRRDRRWLSLLAALAIFAITLAPSISRAMAASAGFDPLAELCSTVGTVSGETGGSGPHLDHCPLCSIGAALPAAEFAAGSAVVPAIDVAAEPAPAPAGLRPWAHAPPRGPPASLRPAA